jgi:hypothetical protein
VIEQQQNTGLSHTGDKSMKTIAAAALGLSLLAGSTVFAQDATTSTTKKEKKVKHNKGKAGETTSTTEKSK